MFSKTLSVFSIQEEKPIATFAVISWEIISSTQNFIQIPQADEPDVVFVWTSFEKRKVEVHIFDRGNLSGFAMWEFIFKEDLNPQKQLFLLNLRLWPAQKPKRSILYGKNFI